MIRISARETTEAVNYFYISWHIPSIFLKRMAILTGFVFLADGLWSRQESEWLMDIECYDDLTGEQIHEWREFVASCQHQHPRQDPRFADVERAIGGTVVFAIARRQGEICAVGLFSLYRSRILVGRYSVALALSGPICDDPETLTEFVVAVSGHTRFAKVDAIKVTPYWLDDDADQLHQRFTQAGLEITDPAPHRDTGLIDLDRSLDELRSSFSRSARRNLRNIEATDVEIRHITSPDQIAVFFDCLNALVIKPNNLTPVTRPEYEAGFQNVYNDPEAGVLFTAYHQDTFLGGFLLYRSRITAFARRFVADPAAASLIGNLRIAPLLWLRGMKWAMEQGCTNLDVEGYLPDIDRSHPDFSVLEYKTYFKPRPVRRVAEHTLVTHRLFHQANVVPSQLKQVARRGVRAAQALTKSG